MTDEEQNKHPTPPNSQPQQTNESQENQKPEWRQPTANVMANPNAAPRDPRKYKKHQNVTVYRESDGWIDAKVIDFQILGDSWEYRLSDKNDKIIWMDQPTWFSQADLDRFNQA